MKNSNNKILVAVDFEDQSMYALEQSYELARMFDADLLLLYVIEGVGILGKLRSPDEYLKNLIIEAHERFDELEKLGKNITNNINVRVVAMVEKGKPYEKIIDIAKDQNVLMIVMGRSSNLSLLKRRRIIGSNTMNVIREAQCPVITINSKLPTKFAKILLPLDFTRQTKKQVQKAIEFGGYFGSHINILSILKDDNKVTKLMKLVQLNQVKKAIQKNGIQCHTEFMIEKDRDIPEIVLTYSKKIDADLIIIMTQQKKNLINYYIGSTAQKVISDSEIPVLSIMPTANFKPGVVTSMVDPLGIIDEKQETKSKRNPDI